MRPILIAEEITKLHSKFKEISESCQLNEETIDSYTESRDQGEGVYFNTEDMEGMAYSYIKALDIIKFVAKSDRSGETIQILEILRPLRTVERVIEEYTVTLKEFRGFMYEELRDAIEPFEDLMIDVINWVANSIYNEGEESKDEDEEDEDESEDISEEEDDDEEEEDI